MNGFYRLFAMAGGAKLLSHMKRNQKLTFDSEQTEAMYDKMVCVLFYIVALAILILIIAKHYLIVPVSALAVYAIGFVIWCRKKGIRSNKRNKTEQTDDEG